MIKIIKSLITIVAVAAVAAGATGAYFSDSEVVAGNTFASGSIDLKVNGEDDGPEGYVPFYFSNSGEGAIAPGETYNAGTMTLSNDGSIGGELTVMVSNPSSNENGMIEPEEAAGDIDGTEVDPTGYDANSGDGELWDMSTMTIYFDMNNNGKMEWNEPVVWNGQHLDMTTHYSIPLDTNLWTANHGFDGVLDSGESVNLGVLVKFKSDAQLASQPQYNGLNNNMAMTDDMSFDLVIGLEQI